MLLNTEELLALVNGDAEPDRLVDLLDRLEHCPESAEALQVLVSLRANREEALEALRRAADHDVTSLPTPHPAARRAFPSMGWAVQGLRMAAAVALVAIVSVWATQYFAPPVEVNRPTSVVDTRSLATDQYDNIVLPANPADAELTSASAQSQATIKAAFDALEVGDYGLARTLLENQPADPQGRVSMYRGISLYFLGEYQLALDEFLELESNAELLDTAELHQAAWYKANALLALDQPGNALSALEVVKSAPTGYWYREMAAERYVELREALGWTSPRHD